MQVKVYLEDTDAQGIVYHANYLKYFERARSDLLEDEGFALDALQQDGWRFIVHELQVKYRRPARLGDLLEVHTTVERASEFRLTFSQRLSRVGESEVLVSAQVQVACIDRDGSLAPLPPGMPFCKRI